MLCCAAVNVGCTAAADTAGHIRVGKLNLVDLAGSERQSKTGATGMLCWFLLAASGPANGARVHSQAFTSMHCEPLPGLLVC